MNIFKNVKSWFNKNKELQACHDMFVKQTEDKAEIVEQITAAVKAGDIILANKLVGEYEKLPCFWCELYKKPNKKTIEAMEEAKHGKLKVFENVNDLLDDLNDEEL